MSNPLPESKSAPSQKKKNPKLILFFGLGFLAITFLVIAFVIIKVVSKKSGDVDQMQPVAEQPVAANPQVASEVSSTPFNPAAPTDVQASAPANAEVMQKLDEITQTQAQIRLEINDLNIAIKAQAVAQEQSTKAMREYVQAILEQRKKEMKPQAAEAVSKKPIIVPPAAPVPARSQANLQNQAKAPQAIQWYVSSSIGERIWISNGERDISLALGDAVEGAGNVVQIDFPNRAVYFSSGLRIGPKVNP